MSIVWDGIRNPAVLNDAEAQVRHELSDAAKEYDWRRVVGILTEHPVLVNTCRPRGKSMFSPLHQVAHGGAPVDVADSIIRLGACRTLQNARGERSVDVAKRRGHAHLLPLLEPVLRRQVPWGILLKIQTHFHQVILERAAEQVRRAELRLPELEALLELEEAKMWFPIPGMAGGFAFQLVSDGVNAKLVAESWCRVVEGSGQRHEIDAGGSRLVAEGFV